MAIPSNKFPKSNRLHLRKEINELFETGKNFHVPPFKVLYKIFDRGNGPIKVTVAVPKRNIRLAVDRNRIKRQTREAYRLNCHDTKTYFQEQNLSVNLLLVFNSKVLPKYAILQSKIILILQRLKETHERNAI